MINVKEWDQCPEYYEGSDEPVVKEADTIILVMRGRNTEGILKDALDHTREVEAFGVICCVNDALREESDLTAKEVVGYVKFAMSENAKVWLVANGGTTGQLLETIQELTKEKIRFVALNVQRDGVQEYTI